MLTALMDVYLWCNITTTHVGDYVKKKYVDFFVVEGIPSLTGCGGFFSKWF